MAVISNAPHDIVVDFRPRRVFRNHELFIADVRPMQLQTFSKRMILRQRDMHSFLPKLSGVATDHLSIPGRYHHIERMAANLADMHAAITLANIDVHQRMIVSELQDQIAQKRSEEQTSELQSLMRISYAVFCLKK